MILYSVSTSYNIYELLVNVPLFSPFLKYVKVLKILKGTDFVERPQKTNDSRKNPKISRISKAGHSSKNVYVNRDLKLHIRYLHRII